MSLPKRSVTNVLSRWVRLQNEGFATGIRLSTGRHMANNKYEKLYQQGDAVCCEPFPQFAAFFEALPVRNGRVLDLGCGQGRDAIFIARLGHRVAGVDLSPTGIKQMVAAADRWQLPVTSVVADIVRDQPVGEFDVVLLDRVLHMLADDQKRLTVLATAACHVAPGAHILIADTVRNMSAFKDFFAKRTDVWQERLAEKGLLFMQRRRQSPRSLPATDEVA